MRYLSLLCLLGWGGVFAQSSNELINNSSCGKPEYPTASKRLEEEGTVQLKFLVGTDGKVIELAVEKSSGFRRLDEAARIFFSKCVYTPSNLNGKLVESWQRIKYTWELDFPTCIGQIISQWDFCLGSIQSTTGGLTVVRFSNGMPDGSGIEYDRNGKVVRSGNFVKGNFVNAQELDEYKYPFNPKLITSKLSECQGNQLLTWNNCISTIKSSNGNVYVGEFVDGRMHGQGIYTYANGDKYTGESKFGKFYGIGEFVYANGTKYIGEFRDDKRNGKGAEYSSNGAVIRQGVWHNDKLEVTFVIGTQSPTSQAVATAEAQPNIPISNLPVCPASGFFQNCFGTYIYPNSWKYVGEWKDNKHNGQGTLYASNGSVNSQGIWVNGNLVRPAVGQQAVTPSNPEISKLRAEAEEAKRLLAQAEEQKRIQTQLAEQRESELQQQLKIAQQRPNFPAPVINSTIGKRIALVVGNANYKVRPLKNAKNDADDVSRQLMTSGFEVIDLRDATLTQMRTAVRQFGDRLINNDVGLVYYSGHGVEVKGRNYFIPVNADIQREDEIADQGLDVSLILEKMSTAGKGVNILIVDACRDDPFGRSFRSSSRGLAQMDAPRGTIIAYATSPGKVASDGDPRERNSPYTKHLVKAMQSPNKPIEQVFKEVRRAVQDETKNQQTPWENTSLSGDFFFKVQR